MLKDSLRNIIYMARRFKTATAFNMIGLIVAFATFYLFATQIIYQVTYNHSLEGHDRLYRIESSFVYNEWKFSDIVCRPLGDALQEMPEVESYSLAWDITGDKNENFHTLLFTKGDSIMKFNITQGNNTVVSALTSKRLSGTIEWTDSDRSGMIIPASIAREYFGTTQAAGKEMLYLYRNPADTTVKQTSPVKVVGVFEDFPANSALLNCIYLNSWGLDSISAVWRYKCYVKFKTVPRDLKAFGEKLKLATVDRIAHGKQAKGEADQIPDVTRSIMGTTLRFTPMEDSYFEHSSYSSSDSGYKGMFFILEIACLLVIVIAAINFLNFTLAESPMRVRSLNTRRVLGASRRSLRLGFVAECVITAVAASLIALLLCQLLHVTRLTTGLTEGSLSLSVHWPLAIIILLIAVVVGIVAGTYPATFATSHEPAMVLKSSFGLTPQGSKLRSGLVFLQLFVSTLMVIYIGILTLQSLYIFHSDYGYSKDRILTAPLPVTTDNTSQERLYQDLLMIPGVKGIAFSNASLGTTDGHNAINGKMKGHPMRFSLVRISPDYLRTMGIDIIEGRDFKSTDSAVVIINEAARDQWDWITLGSKVSTGFDSERDDSAVVIGVSKYIRYGTTRINNKQPFIFILDKESPYSFLNVRADDDADLNEVKRQVNAMLSKYYGIQASEGDYIANKLLDTYKNESRYFKQVLTISIICLILTLVGVFCLTMFETEYRRKEIGIRKVAGATTREIVVMLCRHYIPLIFVSFAIGAPIAGFLGWLTLQYFDERTVIQWWLYPLALLVVGGFTLAIVILQSWRAARENPVNSISTE